MSTILAMLTSWKTTMAGIAALGTGITMAATALSSGDFTNLGPAIAAIISGIGGIMAKDANVTNASPAVQAPSATTVK